MIPTVTDTMEAKAKERLYRLIHQIPEGEVHTAERFLEYLTKRDDVEEILTLQPRRSKAKVYQVKQVRKLINKYRLASDGEDE